MCPAARHSDAPAIQGRRRSGRLSPASIDLAVRPARWQAAAMQQTVQQAAAANSHGMNALREGDYKSAAEAFERAVAADPHSGALLRNLASAHRGAGDDEAELAALERALDIDRRDLVAWMRKAELHQRRDEQGQAFEAWNAALALAQPLRPWTGPMAESLERGLKFRTEAAEKMRAVIDQRMSALPVSLDEVET